MRTILCGQGQRKFFLAGLGWATFLCDSFFFKHFYKNIVNTVSTCPDSE